MQAMIKVAEEVPQARILIQCSPDLDVPSQFIRLPRLSHREIRDLYRSASVIVVPTRHNEHFSGMTVALEAMSVGRPVVLSDTPGASDYVRPGVDGFLVPPGDVVGFAHRVVELLRDPEAAERLGEAGAMAVASRFQQRHLAKSIREFVEFLHASEEDSGLSSRAARG
ncbi:glycosyltransferase [Rhodococcus hoagii]|nr:glycosyltransferase [Prescottella equi]